MATRRARDLQLADGGCRLAQPVICTEGVIDGVNMAVADLEIWKGGFSGECSEQRHEVLISLPRKARKIFFAVTFQLPGWAVVAPSCFALPLLSGFRAIRDRLHDSRNALLLLIPFQLSVQ